MRTPFLFGRVVSTLALLTSVSACSVQSEAPPPDLHNRDVRFTLLHTADWHSRLFPYQMTVTATDASLGLQQTHAPFGGAARMNWLIQRERAQADRVLHLDSGDCFEGAPIFNFFNGEAEVRALDATGVDGAAVGNHEFDRGAVNFATQYQRWATFPVLAANYLFEDPTTPGSAGLANFVRPYHIYDVHGLKVGVIGFGNLSSVTSLFDQPNRTGATALNTQQIAQFYIDFLRGQNVDLIVGLSHLGLSDDQTMISTTSGFDVVLGGHLHIVLNPPNVIPDCQPFDDQGHHFIPELDPNVSSAAPANCDPTKQCCRPEGACRPDPLIYHGLTACSADSDCSSDPLHPFCSSEIHRCVTHGWTLAPGYRARRCRPRNVVLQHSGAFMKFLGRLDLVLTDNPSEMQQGDLPDGGEGPLYDPQDRFEVISHRYTLFPVDSTVPEEPTEARLLEPYAVALGQIANLDNLVGYAPAEIIRTNQNGGDSPMGNLVTTAMWRRLGIQTDFSMTNTLGIRDNIPPGPVTIDQIYNVFPFDNQITTMLLSGHEVRDMFDFIARRSSGRGCNSQAQIAGARVLISCGACDRDGIPGADTYIDDTGQPAVQPACAETVNIGLLPTTDANGLPIPGVPQFCNSDADCLSCPYSDEAACNGSCAHIHTDPLNCGHCGNFCGTGQVCDGGNCAAACSSGTACNGSCVDLQSDPNNCGACGNSCNGATCVGGMCGGMCPAGTTASGGKCCPSGQINCGGVCRAGPDCLDSPQFRSLCNPPPPSTLFADSQTAPCHADSDCMSLPDTPVCNPTAMVCATRSCSGDADCQGSSHTPVCGMSSGRCTAACHTDSDCLHAPGTPTCDATRGQCIPRPSATGRCMLPIAGETINGSYALATNDYVANGGSGFFVLQRNTTQVNTGVQLRDAVTDHVQLGNPCGFDDALASLVRSQHPGRAFQPDDGLQQCATDADCTQAGFVCTCPDRYRFDETSRMCASNNVCGDAGNMTGHCVLQTCQTDMTRQVARLCPTASPHNDPSAIDRCNCAANSRGGETCRILACFDDRTGAFADGRIHMVTQ